MNASYFDLDLYVGRTKKAHNSLPKTKKASFYPLQIGQPPKRNPGTYSLPITYLGFESFETWVAYTGCINYGSN